ncbi:hypothetical protein NDU88_003797 [Pleurodeles waltl]|uniref:Uncharacterized protein n=1 Tax=Pleurodeles waltl TaxID=8319 RepID=A0AAV7LHZ6_PLEWA|nr:hypothetical protein NDU88_003797 [Pleurodeles waltl]
MLLPQHTTCRKTEKHRLLLPLHNITGIKMCTCGCCVCSSHSTTPVRDLRSAAAASTSGPHYDTQDTGTGKSQARPQAGSGRILSRNSSPEMW